MKKAILARPYVMISMNTEPPVEDGQCLMALLEMFFDYSMPGSTSAQDLAVMLAKRTRILRDIVLEELTNGSDNEANYLQGFHEAFRTHFMNRLDEHEFSDLYAQTVTYGLFAARTRSKDGFNRELAYKFIPKSIGILRDIFHFVSLGELPRQLEWIIDDIAQVLARTNVAHILDEYFHQGRGSDPIVHFYETFLAEYDPAERERRGVYYTPEPVVDFIVRSANDFLKKEFGHVSGLASDKVTILDPAAGTMTFIAKASQAAVSEFEKSYGSGAVERFIRSHILEHFFAFELMMAPYAVGHLKMSFFLEELGCVLGDDDRMKFFLTNALEREELEQTNFPLIAELAKESELAGEVKRKQPVLAIMGNPPYSGHSSNTGKWISSLVNDYKQVDGEPLGEKNSKWLQDDYVKFIRFAQDKIVRTGKGIVAVITNHSYLDNPTFRGMRKSLMDSFDYIYVLDLHGNSLKKEKCPDGSKDENVFDIRQGTAITFFIRTGKDNTQKTVFHADLWGTRKEKYDWLDSHAWADVQWEEINPSPDFYFFKPRDEVSHKSYQNFISIKDIFSVKSNGLVTARDNLTIHMSSEQAWITATSFYKSDPEVARLAYALGKDVRDWKVDLAQRDIRDSGPSKNNVVPVLYRPFDVRYTYYTGRTRGFICMPRPEVMHHMLAGDNLALVIGRQGHVVGSKLWDLVLVAKEAVDLNIYYRGGGVVHPLYLYPDKKNNSLFQFLESSERRQNFSRKFEEYTSRIYTQKPSPKEIFNYIYAVLYSPAYRDKYAQFLKSDFPRIPFPRNKDFFLTLAEKGARLVNLHLLDSEDLNSPLVQFEGGGDFLVAKNKAKGFGYDSEKQRMHINKNQYFGPIDPDVYQYKIGGYQVLDKWLKDRKGRWLSLEEITTYCRIATALIKTIEIQKEIDDIYLEAEKDVI